MRKEIKGFPNYEITIDGRIFRKPYIKKSTNVYGGYEVPKQEYEVFYHLGPKGYPRIGLFHRGNCVRKFIHVLVAENFIGNPNNKPFINHKDGNKVNFEISNLEWVTGSENIKHGYDTGLIVRNGSGGIFHKLQKEDIPKIRALLSAKKTNREIAKLFGVTETTISCVKLGKTWRHVSKIL